MTIRLNGEQRELADGTTLAALLDALSVRRDGIAVALNDAVVPRGAHATTVLRDGDHCEVIVAVAGG